MNLKSTLRIEKKASGLLFLTKLERLILLIPCIFTINNDVFSDCKQRRKRAIIIDTVIFYRLFHITVCKNLKILSGVKVGLSFA